MAQHILGIDHCVILVPDLDAAAASWQRLGFTVSPRGVHSPQMGTANHTIMFVRDEATRDYLELLAPIAETDLNAPYRAELASRGPGPGAVALKTDDADAAMAELRAHGIGASEVIAFARPVPTEDGSALEAAFRVTRLPPGSVPGHDVFVCGQLTPHAVWRPELIAHPNGAFAISSVLVASADPMSAAKHWQALFGDDAVKPIVGGQRVGAGATRVRIHTPQHIPAELQGFTPPADGREGIFGLILAVDDLAVTAGVLAANGVPFTEAGPRLVVPPEWASGTALGFEAE
jgi:catechol 2,3-dioxygenase-like lactoylglutathione lyase family enzyme